MGRQITEDKITCFREYLLREERSQGTCEKYQRDVRRLMVWLASREITKETVAEWKERLLFTGYAPVTINSMLSAVNSFLRCMGWDECRVKFLRIQRRMFRDQSRELGKSEYRSLLTAARSQSQEQTALLMETICGTGIRVSEVKYVTVEAVKRGRADIALKGKIRTILFPARLCRKLLRYVKKQKIVQGEIFRTEKGGSISRYQIWREMKKLCRAAGVEESKVFPHNLRHLFAIAFYQICGDIVKLADVLGHSSIETTRVYLITTGEEHLQQLDRLGLVV